jgi:hypothetical protein
MCGTAVAPDVGMGKAITVFTLDPDLEQRIRAEYREWPTLSLTPIQAARLWQVEPVRCAAALAELAQDGLLRRVGDRYVRIDMMGLFVST